MDIVTYSYLSHVAARRSRHNSAGFVKGVIAAMFYGNHVCNPEVKVVGRGLRGQ